MASRLYPNRISNHKDNNSMKYIINCKDRIVKNPETNEWLELISKFDHTSEDYKIYKGLIDKNKAIVAKISPDTNKLQIEFDIGKLLKNELNLPTFMSYCCIFKCVDNFSQYGEKINVLISQYLPLGQILDYKWDRNNFNILKNIMKHIVLSVLYSNYKC
jgi:hypothetical protein